MEDTPQVSKVKLRGGLYTGGGVTIEGKLEPHGHGRLEVDGTIYEGSWDRG